MEWGTGWRNKGSLVMGRSAMVLQEDRLVRKGVGADEEREKDR